jgi:hypothetical protein
LVPVPSFSVEDIAPSSQILAEITAFQYVLLKLYKGCDIGWQTRTRSSGSKGTIPNGFFSMEYVCDKTMASKILSKSTSDGVKRWTELKNVLGASVDGITSILKQVILGFKTKMTIGRQ